ncbi:MAG: hypothetical protein H8E26_11350 [FCB group bacterium]|nr:hypothetical protein [FCB group bacterium]MBL7029216.1 hypothetical protein [Candidatus Neomarinimicrobiota bacterium]MBL7121130.1 hypothetical protein [Candidatus Neomarinimicrobiota bacterium]
MEKDFHFYVTYALAYKAGFSSQESRNIAYSSQYLDDNNESQYPRDDGPPEFPFGIRTSTGFFRPIMTQSMSVKSLVYEIQKFVYVPFHFLPGDNNRPINGELNKYSTTPDSKNARDVLRSALKTKNPYRIGIAVHTYADTWSHQNFTGYEEDWNSVFHWRNPFRSIAPNIGHSDVGHLPDEISSSWNDYRLEKPYRSRNNKKNALQACKRIFQELRRGQKGKLYWTQVEKDFRQIINAEDYDDRIKKVKDYLNEPNLSYREEEWIDKAVKGRKGEDIQASADFINTDWYNFQLAAKAHLVYVLDLLKNY